MILLTQLRRLAASLGLALTIAMPSYASAPVPARIVNVSDGDSVTALTANNQQIKVRLANIDAPETGGGRCRPGQPYADRSRQYLSDMVKGRQVTLVCMEVDRYGRSICDVHIDGTTANREMARAGMAWANRANPRFLRDNEVAMAEARAISVRAGLWQDPRAIPPWAWRREAWNTAEGCKR